MRVAKLKLPTGLMVAAVALAGCSVLYDSNLPDGCEVEDADGDGALAYECIEGSPRDVDRLGDCDDNDPLTYPGAPEECDGIDTDCDGIEDNGIPTTTLFADCDGDGVGSDLEVSVGCGDPGPSTCEGGLIGGWSMTPGDCDDEDDDRQANCGSCAQVDLLIVMDTSNSMLEEQVALAAQLPMIVAALKTGDVDGDGTPEAEPIDDLQVGVITPDLGSGMFNVPTCEMGGGDDAVLQIQSGAIDPRCASIGPSEEAPFLSFQPGDTPADVVAATEDWSCLVRQGTGGCGFEQPLEAALKALSPAASTLRFRDDTLGHGDGLNSGFLREDSLLVVVVITDEDDCSAADPELFWPTSPSFPGDLNLRCHEYPESIHPVSRYVSGLLQLRSAEDLVFAVVAGVPEDIAEMDATNPDYESILGHSALQEAVEASGTRLEYSCDIPGRGSAFPPRRLLETAAGLAERGSTTVLSSICSRNSYSSLAAAMLQVAVDHGTRRCSR